MLKITIKKDKIVTNVAQFETQTELDSWLDKHIAMGTFQFENITVPAQFDFSGNTVIPSHVKPATHTKEIEVLSVDQDKVNSEAQAYLDSTDWYIVRFIETGVEVPEEISEARQDARDRIVR